MRKILVVFAAIALFSSVFAAEPNYSFQPGKLTQYEADLAEYENDKDAEAVVIYEFGENRFRGDDSYGFILHKNKKTKIKILKEAGLDYADFEIPVYVEGVRAEELHINSAVVYNYDSANGLIKTELDRKKVFTEKINDRWVLKKFTMPAVKPGSIIELDYTIRTPYFFNMGRWNFQKRIPVVYSRLKYRAMPYYVYSYILVGANDLDEFDSDILSDEQRFGNLVYKEVEYIFGMKNIPAFKDEEFISSPKNYMISLNFQLSTIHSPHGGTREIMSKWPQLCNDFLKSEDFGKYVNDSEKRGKKILPEMGIENLSPEEKLKAITLYVKSIYNWNGECRRFASDKLSVFINKKTGSSADINLFLTGLLKAAGLDVYPILLSTRDNGAISKLHPFESFFNYVVAMVTIDGKRYFIDATEPMLYYTSLPERCMNVEGLVIKPKSEEWVVIYEEEFSVLEKTFAMKIYPDLGKIDVNSDFIASGNKAFDFRKIYMNKSENLVDYLKKSYNLDVTSAIAVENAQELEEPFSFSFDFNAPVERVDNKLFVVPFCGLSLANNLFRQNSRTLPVDLMYFRGEKYKSVIEIPEGYKVESLPRKANVDNRVIVFTYEINVVDNTIEIVSDYNFKKVIYAPEEYIVLRNLVKIVIDKLSENIVLAKEA